MKVKFLDGKVKEFETLAWADLAGADFGKLAMRGESLTGANLEGAFLRGADFEGVDLRGANLSGADLRGVNLSGADLRGANLSGAYMVEADLTFANLRGAKFKDAAMCQSALLGAVLDKEQYARLRDILDEVGKTVDDEGTRAQVRRDREIHEHYEHAKEKHPVFADILSTGGFTLGARHYKAHLQARHDAGECTPMDILYGEYLEVLEAIDAKDKAQAVYECYDCIAVLLRLIDMIEETAEKEEWKEEGR